jgi:hypothetical protein
MASAVSILEERTERDGTRRRHRLCQWVQGRRAREREVGGGGHRERQTETDRQTDRQTDRDRERKTETESVTLD